MQHTPVLRVGIQKIDMNSFALTTMEPFYSGGEADQRKRSSLSNMKKKTKNYHFWTWHGEGEESKTGRNSLSEENGQKRRRRKKRSASSIADRVNFLDMTMNRKAEKLKHTQLGLIRTLQKCVDLLMTAKWNIVAVNMTQRIEIFIAVLMIPHVYWEKRRQGNKLKCAEM
jgi:hypothetical protein